MQTLQSYIRRSDAFRAFAADRKSNIKAEGLDGFPLFQCAHLMAESVKGNTWIVCPTEEMARTIYGDNGMVKGLPVTLLPTSGRVLYSAWEGSSKEYEQIRVLGNLSLGGKTLIVTSIRAFCSPVPGKNAVASSSLTIKANQSLDTMEVADRLSKGNYFRSPNTTMPGEFTLRGEVLDIFPYGEDLPVRIYLDWDRVERICRYEPLSQQVTKQLGHVTVRIMAQDDGCAVIPQGISEYISPDDYFIFVGDKRLESSFRSLQLEAKSLYRHAYQADHNAVHPTDMLFDFESFYGSRSGSMTVLDIAGQTPGAYRFDIDGPRSYFGNFTFFKQDLDGLTGDGWDIKICVSTVVQKQRLETMLSAYEGIEYIVGNLSGGFSIRSSRFIVFCENEIFGRKKQVLKTLQHTQTSVLDSFVELHEGDYVVHVNYGIGIFLKIDRVRERD
ncbi:MAG: transcription-repair coupling factor, partial [Spirochaetales bacterium]|nr:transcription-repair coupling factor [Spirochaetales bacterium]